MVSHLNYNPDEIEKQHNPRKDDLAFFYTRKAKLADDELYLSLKKRDDDIKKQLERGVERRDEPGGKAVCIDGDPDGRIGGSCMHVQIA